jgi:hypothetical protein
MYGHIEHMEKMTMHTKLWSGNQNQRDHFRDRDINETIKLGRDLKENLM